MFDKIFKIGLLVVLAFIAFTFYLYVQNTRYYSIEKGLVLDKRTGQVYVFVSIKINFNISCYSHLSVLLA